MCTRILPANNHTSELVQCMPLMPRMLWRCATELANESCIYHKHHSLLKCDGQQLFCGARVRLEQWLQTQKRFLMFITSSFCLITKQTPKWRTFEAVIRKLTNCLWNEVYHHFGVAGVRSHELGYMDARDHRWQVDTSFRHIYKSSCDKHQWKNAAALYRVIGLHQWDAGRAGIQEILHRLLPNSFVFVF